MVKDAFGLPYIPGSSLRGKLRSLLENALGLTAPAELVYLVQAQAARKSAFTRAIARMTKSACCSAAIRDAWSASQGEALDIGAATSRAPGDLRRAARSPRASPRRCARIWTTKSPK